MKKIYLLLSAALIASAGFAQRVSNQAPFSFDMQKAIHQSEKGTADTIYYHFIGGTPALYTSGSGYVAGQNDYGDIAKMQLMDAAHGLNSNSGVITDLLFWFGHVEGNPNSFIKATIWADNAGTPSTVLGTTNVPYSAIDTSTAGFMTNGVIGWNAVATFATPIAIPANQKFWAGFEVIYAAGDTVGLVTTTDGDFSDAVTNTFEKWSDNSYHSFNDGTTGSWQLNVALGVFPILDLTSGIEESTSVSFNVFPNPSTGEFNINLTSENSGNVDLSVKNVVGQTVINKTIAVNGKTKETISLADYSKGIYFLTVDNKTTKLIVE